MITLFHKKETAVMKSKRGFTLLEMMISVVIFVVVMAAVFLTYMSGTRLYGHSTKIAQMRTLTQLTMSRVEKDLADCMILDTGMNRLDEINFQRPTPRQNAFGELRYVDTSTNEPFWGDGETEVDGSGETHVDNTLRLSFVRDRLLDESVDGVDYNLDGDTSDVFEEGRIVRSVLPAGGGAPLETRNLCSFGVVFKPVLPAGLPHVGLTAGELAPLDIDGANGPDPLFLIIDDAGNPDPTGGRIQVKIFTMVILDGRPMLVHRESVITPVGKMELP